MAEAAPAPSQPPLQGEVCLLLGDNTLRERLVECSFEMPIGELIQKALPGVRARLGRPLTLVTASGHALPRSKTLKACGFLPQKKPAETTAAAAGEQVHLLRALCVPANEQQPQDAAPLTFMVLAAPRPPPLRLSMVQAKNGNTDIFEVDSNEKVSYLEAWVERRFAVRAHRGSSASAAVAPTSAGPQGGCLPGSNGKGFVLIHMGQPLQSGKTLAESGLSQHATVYILFAADAPTSMTPQTTA